MLSKQFASFAVTGGIAALVNLASRWGLSHFLHFEVAVALGYLAGMTTAFVLARHFVFEPGGGHWTQQYLRFGLVNLVSFLVVMGVSVGLVRWGFPAIGMDWHAEDLAHLIGVASPIVLSFYAHRHFTFGRRL